jgi:1-deoxy-D-xylulose-5-phosphate reductoisomerase
VAVERFCARQLGFTGIAQLVTRVMNAHRVVEQPSLEQILEADRWARAEAESLK